MTKRWSISLAAVVLFLFASSAAYSGNFLNPATIPEKLDYGLGLEYDLTTRGLVVQGNGDAQFLSNRILLDVAFNPIYFFGLKLKGGAANMSFSEAKLDKISKLTKMNIVPKAENQLDKFDTPFNFAGGGSLDFAILKDPDKYVGLGFSLTGLYQYARKDNVNLSAYLFEYGAALTLSVISLDTIIPYLGFDYSGETGRINSTDARAKYTLNLADNLDSPVGIFAGMNVVIGDHWRLEFQGRFLNELSGGLSFLYNF